MRRKSIQQEQQISTKPPPVCVVVVAKIQRSTMDTLRELLQNPENKISNNRF
jgi:hypothetical protein